jgi:hypothetical protein
VVASLWKVSDVATAQLMPSSIVPWKKTVWRLGRAAPCPGRDVEAATLALSLLLGRVSAARRVEVGCTIARVTGTAKGRRNWDLPPAHLQVLAIVLIL